MASTNTTTDGRGCGRAFVTQRDARLHAPEQRRLPEKGRLELTLRQGRDSAAKGEGKESWPAGELNF